MELKKFLHLTNPRESCLEPTENAEIKLYGHDMIVNEIVEFLESKYNIHDMRGA